MLTIEKTIKNIDDIEEFEDELRRWFVNIWTEKGYR